MSIYLCLYTVAVVCLRASTTTTFQRPDTRSGCTYSCDSGAVRPQSGVGRGYPKRLQADLIIIFQDLTKPTKRSRQADWKDADYFYNSAPETQGLCPYLIVPIAPPLPEVERIFHPGPPLGPHYSVRALLLHALGVVCTGAMRTL
ncbi:hypothetical protein D9619_011710 [Psilocybe cf. subviscida]|uniref:Secreted protein n=1 Tax=Psilocybe cf. subviscida TaxID=2480587 RepID=A0A8H5BUP6_9AGAR|nr:hypothetical protein D9619_011710 [Psilocybe cf. subviscida]